MSWGWNYYARALTPGLAEAAAFLRRQAQPGERFAVAPLERGWAPIERPGWVPSDRAVELAALSGIPAYLARPYLPILEGGERRLVAEARLAALEAIERETQPRAALERLAALHVTWYVVVGEKGPRWDTGRRLPVFTNRRVAVYRTTSL